MSSGASRLARWNPWRGLGALPREIWVLFAATLVNRAGTMVLPFLVLYLTEHLGFSARRAGAALACYGLGSLVGSPLGGRLADRIGSPAVMRISLFSTSVMLAILPWVRSSFGVLLGTFLFALCSEAFRPASMTFVSEAVPGSQRKAAYSVVRLAVNLGMSVGPAVGGFLADYSFVGLFAVDSLTALAAGLVLVRFPLDRGVPRAPSQSAPSSVSLPAIRDPRFVTFLLATIAVSIVFFQHVGAMPLHIVSGLGYSPSFFGLLFSLNTILIVLFEVRLNLGTAHWPHAWAFLTGAVFLGVGFGGLAVAREPWAIAGTVVLWTIGEMMLLPSMSNFVAELASVDRRGEYMGVYSMAWAVAFSIGPWLGTETLTRYGPVACWSGTMALALVAGVFMAHVGTTRPRAKLT